MKTLQIIHFSAQFCANCVIDLTENMQYFK